MRASPATALALILLMGVGCDAADPSPPPSVAGQPTARPSVAPPLPPAGVTPRPPETAARPQGSTVESPDERTIALIYYSLSASQPPQTWAAQEGALGAANEFDRQARVSALRQELSAQLAQAEGIGRLKIPVRSDISQYDPQRGAYYVGLFGGASSLSFSYHGQSYRLELTNKDKAQAWRLSADEAQRVLENNSASRSVVVTVTLELLSAYAKADGGVIRVRVLDYAVENPSTNALLGRVEVPQT